VSLSLSRWRLVVGRSLRSLVGTTDGAGGAVGVPVAVARDVVVGSDIAAAESKVVRAQRPVGVVEVSVVGGDGVVVADTAPGAAGKVVAESAKRCVILLEDDGLSLDLADLLGDDLLGHLLEHDKPLLDDLDGLRVADKLAVLLHDSRLEVVRVGEVVRAIKVVKVAEGTHATPVVEGLASAGSKGIGGLVGHRA